tara:strand:+ start:90 stop:281 length:192 start_codon:yes stop_codon:yes gene_type:complete
MIKKWIKSLIEKVFGKKEEPVILENEVKYEIGTVVETPVIKKIVCNTHKTRFKKSCPTCRAAK